MLAALLQLHSPKAGAQRRRWSHAIQGGINLQQSPYTLLTPFARSPLASKASRHIHAPTYGFNNIVSLRFPHNA
jgi:hypothetical protein